MIRRRLGSARPLHTSAWSLLISDGAEDMGALWRRGAVRRKSIGEAESAAAAGHAIGRRSRAAGGLRETAAAISPATTGTPTMTTATANHGTMMG